MATASIPVDLLNPGQVFACLGLMELAEGLCGDVVAAFDWGDPGEVRFVLGADGDADPITTALLFLASAEVKAIAPQRSGLATAGWAVEAVTLPPGSPYPAPVPASPAGLVAALSVDEVEILVSSWADIRSPDALTTGRDNLKFWGGSGGKPGAQFVAEALDLCREAIGQARDDPFDFSAPQGGSLRFDWRRDYIPLQIGFSLNNHKARMSSRGFPLVEVLAAVGLTHARPRRQDKLHYHYGVLGRSDGARGHAEALLPPPLVRAALGCSPLPFPIRTFAMHLDHPDKHSRCITHVFEETRS